MNRLRSTGQPKARLTEVCRILAAALGTTTAKAPAALQKWAAQAGLPRLAAQGLRSMDYTAVAQAALASSSMKANPVALRLRDLQEILSGA